MENYLEKQPKDILIGILLDLPLRDVLNFCSTSKKFREICKSEDFVIS